MDASLDDDGRRWFESSFHRSRQAQYKEAYKKIRKTLELPNFPRRAIREVKIFKNREPEYVYSRWVTADSPKRVRLRDLCRSPDDKCGSRLTVLHGADWN